MNQEEFKNRLVEEKSPYLLQHASNPINWFSWSDEAFKKAKAENKPIFVSIGYSTCHWCHVMAHESFEDKEVANYLNKNYICVKVDREMRPDIDDIYMDVCVSLTGSGGWPLSVFIDSDKKPFYAGTYFPKDYFLKLLKHLKNIWDNEPHVIDSNTKIFVEKLKVEENIIGDIDVNLVHRAFKQYFNNFDFNYGGMKGAPKFPTPHNLLFLLAYSKTYEKEDLANMCFHTLDSMRKGGIYDHLGYGFSRYSTDELWLVPHFEKMLYDNALLMDVYARSYMITNKSIYLKTAKEIASYLLRKMKDKLGGLYTAEDADSEGSEGTFYIFLKEEIENLLNDNAASFMQYYNVTENGNFEDENILNLIGHDFDSIDNFSEERKILAEYQNKREQPFLDKKILLDNNALAISGFCSLYRATKDRLYLLEAIDIYNFITKFMYKDKRLFSSYVDGVTKDLGFAKDYAYFINSLIDLHQVTYDYKYIKEAIELTNIMFDNFYDIDIGGFYQTDIDAEIIIHRKKEIYDGATPSSNSVMIYNLLRLFELTSNFDYYEAAEKTLKCFSKLINEYPLGYMYYNYALIAYTEGFTTIRLISNEINDVKEYIKEINKLNISFLLTIYENPSKEYPLVDSLPTAYICFGKECRKPVNDLDSYKEILKEIK